MSADWSDDERAVPRMPSKKRTAHASLLTESPPQLLGMDVLRSIAKLGEAEAPSQERFIDYEFEGAGLSCISPTTTTPPSQQLPAAMVQQPEELSAAVGDELRADEEEVVAVQEHGGELIMPKKHQMQAYM